jgi:hypothetical protein
LGCFANLYIKFHISKTIHTEELFDVDRQTEGRTDRHNDVNCPLSHFCERTQNNK